MKKVDIKENFHGTIVLDPYRWLENAVAPEVSEWINQQNQKTASYLQSSYREEIKEQLKKYLDYPRYSVPRQGGKRYFYTFNDGLKNQPLLYYRDGLKGVAQLLLDPNQLSDDGTVALMNLSPSRDGNYLAISLSEKGSDWQKIKIIDVNKQEFLTETIEHCKFAQIAWHPDHRGFYYNRFPTRGTVALGDESNFSKVYYHQIRTTQSEDKLIYECPEHKEYSFAPFVSHDGQYLFLYVSVGTDPKNRLYFKKLDSDSPFIKLLDQADARYFPLGNQNATLYLHTDLNATKGRVVTIDLDKPQEVIFKEVIAEKEEVIDQGVMINNHLILSYLQDAINKLFIYDLAGNLIKELTLPTLGSVYELSRVQNEDEFFIGFTSFLHPHQVLHYCWQQNKINQFGTETANFNTADFKTQQIFYKSKDGTAIPLFLIEKKGNQPNGKRPTILYGYGGFAISMTPNYAATMMPWLEQGGLYAVACLRGGNEYGEKWHSQGMLDQKQNVFDDFIAAGEWLIENNYTSVDKLSIMGGSNGGLLVAASMIQKPQLFGAVVCRVPVIDMLRYHKFTVGRYWIPEYGNAEENPEHFKFLYAYSPLHNVQQGEKYPPILIMTADTDDRVVPGHALKFGATLMEKASSDSLVLLRVETKAGHGQGKPISKIIDENADIYAFLHYALKL